MHQNRRLIGWFALVLAVFLAAPAAVRAASQNELERESVTIGWRHRLESKILGETRSYVVHTPPGYEFSNDSYGVIILLDGDTLMHPVTTVVDFLANNRRSTPILVVGIENTDRQRDLTPPITTQWDTRPSGVVGGAEKFLAFIADEVIPEVDRSYRTRPTRILIGHSYGGLFTVYGLFNRPEMFKAYIAISPSLAWDNQALAKQADQFVADHKELRTAVYMTMANEGGPNRGGAQKVIGSLASSPSNTIATEFKHWPEESHGSVVMRSVYEGLEWLHEFYYTHDPFTAYELSGLQYFDKKFAMLSEYLGYEVKIPAHVLGEIQEVLTFLQRPAEAQQVLEKLLQLYPHSAHARYELAKLHIEANDSPPAIEALKRTLELYPGNNEARTALAKLGVDPNTVVVDAKPSAGVLRSYVGEYRYADEISHLTLADGKLFIKVRNDKHELRPRSDVNFYAVDLDREYTFRKKAGRAAAMTVHLPDFNYDSVKVK
jgi:predicted alpha/beta superfamily hydrolase